MSDRQETETIVLKALEYWRDTLLENARLRAALQSLIELAESDDVTTDHQIVEIARRALEGK